MDFRSDAFRTLSRERQEAVILDTYKLGAEVRDLARAARVLLQTDIRIQGHRFCRTILILIACALAAAFVVVMVLPGLLNQISGAVEWARACNVLPTKP